MDILNNLNTEQQEAVKSINGPVLVIAGAGSGKTKVLTHRVAYIIKKQLAYPNEILTVTFTNKASKELKERIGYLTQNNLSLQWTGTFHSICAKILRIDGSYINIDPNYTIYDPDDQTKLMKEVLEDLNKKDEIKKIKLFLNMISKAKRELVPPKLFNTYYKTSYSDNFSIIYQTYQKKLEQAQALDFDDLISKTIKLLKENAEIQNKYQSKFKYILIDEFQDTNYSQYELVKLLLNPNKNLFVVGDDAQSIYKWRGADISNILNFKKDFPNAIIIKLEQNYRSTKIILEATNAIIRNNPNQMKKKLWTANENGDLIKIYQAENEYREAEFIAKKIKNSNFKTCAILYRTNAQSRIFEEVFLTYNLPYKLIGAVHFYQRKEIKDILAYLRLITNFNDDISLKRIINVPKRGIGKTTIEKLIIISKKYNLSLFQTIDKVETFNNDLLSEKTKRKLIQFIDLIKTLKENLDHFNLIDYLEYMLKSTAILEQYKDKTEENLNRIENIKEFLSIATKYKNQKAHKALQLFLEEVSLLEEGLKQKNNQNTNQENFLMTIHASKGLEFDVVFVAGLEQNLFPHSRSFLNPDEMEEERRLAYVAFTRAKKNLFLTYSKYRTIYGTTQKTIKSQFIDELPEDLIQYENELESVGFEEVKEDIKQEGKPQININIKTGDMVKSPYFGIGEIIEIGPDSVKVRFLEYGIKELALEYARLEII